MLRRFFYAISFLLLWSSAANAQYDPKVWYFGFGAGLDFRSGAPVAITGSKIYADEGCAAVSDRLGNLLFYTDGRKVLNRNHDTLTNGTGLQGSDQATQSSLISPLPGDTNKWYLFTMTALNGSTLPELSYSIIDMSKNGGKGEVITKNVLLRRNTSERITLARHVNRTDYWIISHIAHSDSFVAYRLTSSGLQAPVVSIPSGSTSANTNSPEGYLKASPCGDRLAMAVKTEKYYEVYDFDNSNGKINNPIQLTLGGSQAEAYGVEFSPNGKILYGLGASPWPWLRQWNLAAGSESDIQNSMHNMDDQWTGALQLGPDGKIYVGMQGTEYVGEIASPNVAGSGCNYTPSKIHLGSSITCQYGLPNFTASCYGSITIEIDGFCVGDSTNFYLSSDLVDSVHWKLTPNGGPVQTSKKLRWGTVFSNNGSHTIEATIYQGGTSKLISRGFGLKYKPQPNMGADRSLCNGGSIKLQPGPYFQSYLWNDGSTDSTLTVNIPGKYWVKVQQGFCYGTDTIRIFSGTAMQRTLPDTFVLCGDQDVISADPGDIHTYLWNDGVDSLDRAFPKEGKYWLRTTLPGCGSRTDTVQVKYIPKPDIYLGADTFLCAGQTITLSVKPDSAIKNIIWSGMAGGTSYQRSVTTPGVYWVRIITPCGSLSDTIRVNESGLPTLPDDTLMCVGSKWTIDLRNRGLTCTWQDNSVSDLYTISQAGTYTVNAVSSCGSWNKTIRVQTTQPPKAFLGKDTIICPGQPLTLRSPWPFATYKWDDGSTDSVRTVTGAGVYKVTVTNMCGTDSASIKVSHLFTKNLYLGNDTMLCMNDSLVLDAAVQGGEYRWQDSSTNSRYVIRTAGLYSVTVKNACGVQQDTIEVDFEDCHCYLYMPTAFRPNNDGMNETIKPSSCRTKRYIFAIYNRYGERVFSTEDPNQAWDGTFHGAPAEEGVYLYTLDVQGRNKQVYYRSGMFHLIR